MISNLAHTVFVFQPCLEVVRQHNPTKQNVYSHVDASPLCDLLLQRHLIFFFFSNLVDLNNLLQLCLRGRIGKDARSCFSISFQYCLLSRMIVIYIFFLHLPVCYHLNAKKVSPCPRQNHFAIFERIFQVQMSPSPVFFISIFRFSEILGVMETQAGTKDRAAGFGNRGFCPEGSSHSHVPGSALDAGCIVNAWPEEEIQSHHQQIVPNSKAPQTNKKRGYVCCTDVAASS